MGHFGPLLLGQTGPFSFLPQGIPNNMSDADLPFWIKLQGFQKWATFWANPKVAHSFLLELGIFSLTEIVTKKVVGIHSTKKNFSTAFRKKWATGPNFFFNSGK